jgi:hypothetical protein
VCHLLGATTGNRGWGLWSRPEKEAKDREDARRVFVDQAARETLSATLPPGTAAGGADGERCTGWPAAMSATRWLTKLGSHRLQSICPPILDCNVLILNETRFAKASAVSG